MSELKLDRRALLAAGAGIAAGGLDSATLAAPARRTFPRGFRWGASTAAHQIEGNNVNSDLWLMENIEPCTINEPQVALTFRAMMTAMPQSRGLDPARMNSQAERLRRAHAEAARRTGAVRFATMNDPDILGMTPQLIAGHTKGFAAIKAAQPKLPTGVTLSLIDFAPANEGSKDTELREQAYGQWMDVARRAGNFVGVQVYEQARIPGPGRALPPPLPFAGPSEQRQVPIALRNVVEYTHQRTGLPIFVTRMGWRPRTTGVAPGTSRKRWVGCTRPSPAACP